MTTIGFLYEIAQRAADGSTVATHRVTSLAGAVTWDGHEWTPADFHDTGLPRAEYEFKPSELRFVFLDSRGERTWWNRLYTETLGIGHRVRVWELTDEDPLAFEPRFTGITAGVLSLATRRGLFVPVLCRSDYATQGVVLSPVIVEDSAQRARDSTDSVFRHVNRIREQFWQESQGGS